LEECSFEIRKELDHRKIAFLSSSLASYEHLRKKPNKAIKANGDLINK